MHANPLAGTANGWAALHTARLYVLTRDAYLSAPDDTRRKLGALDELRRVVTDLRIESEDAEHAPRGGGVRLLERLRARLRHLAPRTDTRTRHLILIDLLTNTWPPTGSGPATTLVPLVTDAASQFAPDIEPSRLRRVTRHHHTVVKALRFGAQLGRSGPPGQLESEVGAVREMLTEVCGLGQAAATARGLLLLAGGRVDVRASLAGGVLFETLPGVGVAACGASVGGRLVGTALARADPEAFLHQLASVDAAGSVRPGLRPALEIAVRGLREDVLAAQPAGEADTRRLRHARRALELELRFLGAPALTRWASRPHLPGAGVLASAPIAPGPARP